MRFRFKRRERRAAKRIAAGIRAVLASILKGFLAVAAWMGGKFTLILIPPDHRRPRQLSFSAGKFLVSCALILAALIAVPALRSAAAAGEFKSAESQASFTKALDGSDALRDEVAVLVSRSAPLTEEIDRIDALLSRGIAPSTLRKEKAEPFAALVFSSQRRHDRSDYGKMVSLRRTLEDSTDLLREAGSALVNLRETGSELPLLWPLKGGLGHLSMLFGYNPNPFTGIPYIHLGLDFGNYRSGDPIVASADGIVVAAYYDPYSGYGNNVIIRHAHGYYSRYAHMRSFMVRAKQKVRQGDVIGIVGSTGRVDAPHLHYEIRLGPEILDPLPFVVYKTPPRKL